LQFVVQKHAASHLHYDFRLEMGGVLKSWAVPKGPSLNPADKRLAMMVEDHPFDYKDFEGIIQPGNYGAGTVMVWDEGTYEPLAPAGGTKSAQNKALLKQLHEGSLKFVLKGKKLKGEFALVHTKGREDNSWLLIKHRDQYATEEPVTDKDRSVISKKTLEQIANNPRANEWQSNRKAAKGSAAKAAASKRSATKGSAAKTAASKRSATKGSATKTAASKRSAEKGSAAKTAASKRSAEKGSATKTAASKRSATTSSATNTASGRAAKSSGTAKSGGRASKTAFRAQRDAVRAPEAAAERKTLLSAGEDEQTVRLKKHELSFTHLGKVFWPTEKYTKRDLLNYYYEIAPFILPYMKDRPQSLNRHPNGINGPSFYQKNVSGKVPEWIRTFPYRTAEDDEDKEFLVCTDEASLLYIVSLGCIEVNPWSSRVSKPDNPDWCIIDLDPDKKTPFDKVIEAAQVTRKVLEAAGVDCWCKTSGSTGLHVYFPLGAKYSYDHSKEFARLVVQLVNAQIPGFTTIERTVRARKGRMYLDFLQNRPQATIAAPYSVRPKPGATVSAPLHWDEVKKGLNMQEFTIRTMPARVRETGDLFRPVLGKGIDMQEALRNLEALQ
ncbi:MAG TPA: non-homologous end-joining DNA ligase, partial [Puia sp.]|nr:non-homologous end-joining DNA ligase [Puia sp.]